MVQWVRRAAPEPRIERPSPPHPDPEAAGRVMPGLAAFFERITPDRGRKVLDLGNGDGASLAVYARYARWVRFADILAEATTPDWGTSIDNIPRPPHGAYDVILIWDILDRLSPADRGGFIGRLSRICAPDALMHAIVESSDEAGGDLLHFSLPGPDRLHFVRSGRPRPAHAPMKPAEVKGVLKPFHLLRAFSTRTGLREYVAVRQWAGESGG